MSDPAVIIRPGSHVCWQRGDAVSRGIVVERLGGALERRAGGLGHAGILIVKCDDGGHELITEAHLIVAPRAEDAPADLLPDAPPRLEDDLGFIRI